MQALSKNGWKWLIITALCAALLIGMLFACRGSKGGAELPPVDWEKSFTAKADIHFGDIEATATINRIGDGVCDITLISPQALNGMKFQYNGNDIEISYLGMSVTMDDDSMLANAMTAAIVKAVDTAARGSGISMKKSGKAILLEGENENGSFSLTFDKENGSLLSLIVPALDLECTFGKSEKDTSQ